MVLIAERVHRLPEAAMMEGAQLARTRQARQRVLLERGGIAFDVFAHLGREHEEAAIDPLSVAGRFLLEVEDRIVVHHQRTPASGGLHGGQRRQLSVLLMNLDRARDVYVAYTVPIC